MSVFLAIYAGTTVSDAKLVGVTSENETVKYVAAKMLEQSEPERDDVSAAIASGRRQALELIKGR